LGQSLQIILVVSLALHFHHPIAVMKVLREIHLQKKPVVLLEESDQELESPGAPERAGAFSHHGAKQLLKEKPLEGRPPKLLKRRKENVVGEMSCISKTVAPVEEGGLIVVAVVGCGDATWSPDENLKRRPLMKAMGTLTDAALSRTQDLIGNDLRENALYGFALLRSWSTASGMTLPGSLSFHMRQVLEAAPKLESRDRSFILCHEVIDAVFMNNPLRTPPIGSMNMSQIFDSYLEMGRH
jgi:hypothetical protein